MVPRMSAVQRPLSDSPVSFKRPPKNEAARSSSPYRIYSSRKATKLLLKPTPTRLNDSDAANRLPVPLHDPLKRAHSQASSGPNYRAPILESASKHVAGMQPGHSTRLGARLLLYRSAMATSRPSGLISLKLAPGAIVRSNPATIASQDALPSISFASNRLPRPAYAAVPLSPGSIRSDGTAPRAMNYGQVCH